MVPVIKDADKKGIVDIAQETAALAAKARDGKLGPDDMQGGTFTISSLGGIGGTAFTPIINAPEVAILGVSKSVDEAGVEREGVRAAHYAAAVASYDHRVVDGASARASRRTSRRCIAGHSPGHALGHGHPRDRRSPTSGTSRTFRSSRSS